MEQIVDGYEDSELSQKHKAALAYVDVILTDPNKVMDEELKASLRQHFSDAELEELTLTAGIACGFSKAAIAWGPPPEMPVMEMPSPDPNSPII